MGTTKVVQEQIGPRVRELRERERWTQDELASRAGVSRNTVVNFEAGRTTPSLEDAAYLALALGVSLRTLSPSYAKLAEAALSGEPEASGALGEPVAPLVRIRPGPPAHARVEGKREYLQPPPHLLKRVPA